MRHSYDSALPSFKISCHVSLFTAFSLAVSVSSMPSSFSSFIAFPTQVAIGLPGGLLTVLGNSFKAGCAGASSGSLSRCPSQLGLLFFYDSAPWLRFRLSIKDLIANFLGK